MGCEGIQVPSQMFMTEPEWTWQQAPFFTRDFALQIPFHNQDDCLQPGEVRKLLPFQVFCFYDLPKLCLDLMREQTQFFQYRNIRIFHLPIFQISTIFWFVSISPRHWAKGGCHLSFFPRVKFLRHESMLEQTNLVRKKEDLKWG